MEGILIRMKSHIQYRCTYIQHTHSIYIPMHSQSIQIHFREEQATAQRSTPGKSSTIRSVSLLSRAKSFRKAWNRNYDKEHQLTIVILNTFCVKMEKITETTSFLVGNLLSTPMYRSTHFCQQLHTLLPMQPLESLSCSCTMRLTTASRSRGLCPLVPWSTLSKSSGIATTRNLPRFATHSLLRQITTQ